MTRGADSVSPSFAILSWDSDRFGYAVARIPADVDARHLPKTIEALAAQNVELAYWFSPERPSSADESLIQRLGGSLVDEKRTYVAPTTRATPELSGFEIRPYAGREPTSRLIELSHAAGEWSRFRTDPRIPRHVFETIYTAWITRSVRHEIADEVLAAYGPGDGAVGVTTVGVKGARADIGLVAVDASARGKGLGRALVLSAMTWSWQRDLAEIQVVTQGANAPACALYEACGFEVENVEYVYHFWRAGRGNAVEPRSPG